MGEGFASRVAGSFLSQLKLPELITTSLAQYEAHAIRMGNHPDQVAQLKQEILNQKALSQIFNSVYYTRKLEESFKAMCCSGSNNEAPKNISIQP